MKKVVVIGGGTGTFNVLMGLKKFLLDIVAVVTMSDDGGSTGRLRDEYGVLPPGDIRRSLVALSEASQIMRKLFSYRFDRGTLNGHSFGNLFLTSLKEILNSDEKAIEEAGKILKIRGRVLPVTLDDVRLCAELEDGQIIFGEKNIDVPKHKADIKIKKVFLSPRAIANQKVLEEIKNADLILIGPGDLYTSIIPNLLVDGICEAIMNSKAKKVYVCNLMTKNGETNNFKVTNFVGEIERYLGLGSLDFVIYEKGDYDGKILREYGLEKAYPVIADKENFNKFRAKFLGRIISKKEKLIRHDSDKLAREIINLMN